MKAFNKIGFHTAVGGNPTGIGDHLKRLDAAGIPFFIKAADGMTGIFDAQVIMRNSSVPHTAVYRRSVRYNGCAPIDNPDVPDYNLEPEAAAVKHWAWHKAGLPTDLDRDLVWVETINEVRKEVAWGDWLGNFAFHTAQIMNAEGYKFSAFGFSSGTPEPGSWETDGMLRYLELCQEQPDKASVALHEYCFRVDDIWFLRGDHIGRFEKLFTACDKHKLKRPKVLITEWGWTYDRVPETAQAMKDIKEVAEYYAGFPEILGAGIWYLGPGFGGIANKAQKLIHPVTEYTLNTTFDVPAPVEKEEDKPVFPAPVDPADESIPALQLEANGRFINDVTIPDDTHLLAGAGFTKTWRVENNGEAAWGDGFHFVHTAGTAMTSTLERPLPSTAPGEQANISIDFTVPNTTGMHFSDWRFRDRQGNYFGDVIYTRIIADPVPTTPVGVSDSAYVADVTIPDDMVMDAGQAFNKTWRVRNSGTRAWGSGFTLDFVGGLRMEQKGSYPLPPTAPGAEANISIDLKAPTISGTHYTDFRMRDDQGIVFGEILYTRIIVPWQQGASLIQPLSQRDPLWIEARLGQGGSPKKIGEWGCLLTCFTMVANAFEKNVTPVQLNHAMTSKGGFLNLYLTKWNALSSVYTDIVYEGKFHGSSTHDLTARIDASLAQGRPVTVQVDFTSETPYAENDQHWVLIVRKDGDDYRINDPWLLPGQEASLRERYGRANQPLQNAIMNAIFYRSTSVTKPTDPVIVTVPGEQPALARLQSGMNVNPDAPHSNPFDNDDLKGMDWVRFVFKLDARVNVAERGHINKSFAQYDPIVRAYHKMGVKTLFVINQETNWGRAPWTGNNDWQGYANDLAAVAGQIARHYRSYGDQVAYQIWNEGDKKHNPASVFVPGDLFAIILKKAAAAIRHESPNSPIVFGGLATGPEEGIAYLKQCKAALNGPWPVDAIGIHPYTRWATRAPFDWGQQYGTLGEAFALYRSAFPDMPFWITELGVADDNEIGSQFYQEIGDYLMDVYRHVAKRYADLVPVVIWFAWTDWMRNAGILDRNGNRKSHVYPAFRAVRNRELNA